MDMTSLKNWLHMGQRLWCRVAIQFRALVKDLERYQGVHLEKINTVVH